MTVALYRYLTIVYSPCLICGNEIGHTAPMMRFHGGHVHRRHLIRRLPAS